MNDKSLISVKTLSKFFTELKKLFAPKEHGTHLTLGTGSGNAYRGDYGNTAYNHSQAAHAPSNAQKNSDITKAEIEAKLTGAITTHTHSYAGSSSAGGAANSVKTNITVKLNSGTTEGTNLFTYNGSTAKTIDITPGSIGTYTKNEVNNLFNNYYSSDDVDLLHLAHEADGHPDLYYTKTQSAGKTTTGEIVDYTKTYNDSSTLVSGATCGTCAEIFNDLTNNRAVGNYSHAEGSDAVASGVYSHAEGYRTRAVSGSSHAEGNQTKASASYTHAEGYKTEASNTAAHAEGQSCIASGTQSHAEGMVTKAIGKYCHSEGYYTEAGESKNTQGAHAEGIETLALNDGAHAEGYCTEAQGKYSHAEGYCSVAVSQAAHAEGYECFAEGTGAHAEGELCIALGNSAHAEGAGTEAYDYQHVQGIYNIPDPDINYMHIVGNGMDDNHRSNAHTLDWEGNAWFQGNVSSDILPTAPDHLANKAYVDAAALSYVCCTSLQYESLLVNGLINDNIIYFITE